MEKFLELVLGTTDVPTYAASFVFALIGAIVSLRFKARKRNKYSRYTPNDFSYKFLLLDNLQRFFTGVLLVFLAFRFTNEFLGKELTVWLAVFIGAGTDQIAGIFEKMQKLARK